MATEVDETEGNERPETQEMTAEDSAYERVMGGEGLDEWFALIAESGLDTVTLCIERDPKYPSGWAFTVEPF